MNEDKTIVMINSKQKKYKNKIIILKNRQLFHAKTLSLLGLIYNDKLKFNNYIEKGTSKKISLIAKIKQKNTLIKKLNIG